MTKKNPLGRRYSIFFFLPEGMRHLWYHFSDTKPLWHLENICQLLVGNVFSVKWTVHDSSPQVIICYLLPLLHCKSLTGGRVTWIPSIWYKEFAFLMQRLSVLNCFIPVTSLKRYVRWINPSFLIKSFLAFQLWNFRILRSLWDRGVDCQASRNFRSLCQN